MLFNNLYIIFALAFFLSASRKLKVPHRREVKSVTANLLMISLVKYTSLRFKRRTSAYNAFRQIYAMALCAFEYFLFQIFQ